MRAWLLPLALAACIPAEIVSPLLPSYRDPSVPIASKADFDPARYAVLGERRRGDIERHADVLRGRAGRAPVFHFVPTVATPDANMTGGFDHLAGAFVVQHMKRVFIG